MSSYLAIRDTGSVVEIDRLRTDKSYLILNVYVEWISKQIILQLQDNNSDREKESFYVYLPITHRSENKTFTNLQIFNIYMKINFIKYDFWAVAIVPQVVF